MEIVAGAGLVVFEGEAAAETTVVGGHYSMVLVAGLIKVYMLACTVVEIIVVLGMEQ